MCKIKISNFDQLERAKFSKQLVNLVWPISVRAVRQNTVQNVLKFVRNRTNN